MVDPYGLVAKAGVWYLVGAVEAETRVFRISRMRAAEISEHAADRPASFDVEAYWLTWCHWFEDSRPHYPVVFRASPGGMALLPAALGAWIWNRTMHVGVADADGWTTLSTSFGFREEARVVLLGLGAQVKVLEPAELRDSLIDTARQVVTVYGERG